MARLKIGISGINAVDNPGPGIGVARSLKEDAQLDVEIVGLFYDALEPGLYMDWIVDRAFSLPYPLGGGEEYVARLIDIRDRHGLDCVIPNLDAELPLFIKYADRLQAAGINTFLPSSVQFRLRGKDRLTEVAREIGLNVPATLVVTCEAEMYEAVEQLGLPLMVKGVFYDARKAFTERDALGHFRGLAAEWGLPVIVQQMIGGEELNVIGLGDGQGALVGAVGIKKLGLSAAGKAWSAGTIHHPAMIAAAEAFVSKTRWRGPFELECMVTPGAQPHLIEINPRFPAWVYFATSVGVNLPAQLLRRMLGQPCQPQHDYDSGKLFLRYSYELVTDMSRFRAVLIKGETP